jgi:hypothetical protein
MSNIPVWVQVVVTLVAAFGGTGTLIQVVSLYRAHRDGIRQREEEADERLVRRLEKDIEILKIQERANAAYIRRLVMALGRAGVEIPDPPNDTPTVQTS